MNKMLFALLTLLSASGASLASERIPVMQIGLGEAFARGTFPTDAQWLGLFCDDDGCELRATAVSIEFSSEVNILDEPEATELLHVVGEPMAVFAESTLTPGAVYTAFRYDGATVDDHRGSGGGWVLPAPRGTMELSWTADNAEYRHYASDGLRMQLLFALAAEGHYGEDTSMPSLIWAGDLDRDGRIDLLLTLPDDNCGFDKRLYLSSRSSGEELLGLAAQLSGHYPACGC